MSLFFALPALLLAAQPAETPPSEAVPMRCGYRIVQSYPHDPGSFTQGLLWHDGHLYESTGQYGRSRLMRVDLESGKAVRTAAFPADQFGEGIALWRDQIIGLTWRSGIGHRWRLRDFKPLGNFRYEGEGWGLALLGEELVLSDGTPTLRFLDPESMTEQRRLTVTFNGRALGRLNELEAIDGEIWANIWMSDAVARIDPATGKVSSYVDLSGLREDAGARGVDSVLNGIAWDAEGRRLFVTGKNWSKLYQIALEGC